MLRLRKRVAVPLVLLIVLVGAVLTPPAQDHLHAAGALLRLEEPDRRDWIVRVGAYPVDEVSTTANSLPARVYVPRGLASAPGLVVVPGVHRLGIDEPRLIAFSRILASYGIVVMTPQLPALADYRVDESSVSLIGSSARQLAAMLHVPRVGVLGLSFAGGMALIAAAQPEYSDSVAYVVAVGAHHDLARVIRFFATNEAPRPDGSVLHMPAHPYGTLVVTYGHAEDFFSAADFAAAPNCLRLLLWEKSDLAWQCSAQLSAQGQAQMARLINGQTQPLLPAVLHQTELHAGEMARVSPRGQLAPLRVPVLLLHGAGDNVIPPSETEWLAREVPACCLQAKLISAAISHVELSGKPRSSDQLALVHWMAQLLSEANASPHGRIPQTW